MFGESDIAEVEVSYEIEKGRNSKLETVIVSLSENNTFAPLKENGTNVQFGNNAKCLSAPWLDSCGRIPKPL